MVIRTTFAEADEVMAPILGRTLTSYIFAESDPSSLAKAEEALKDTTITQPAVLTANVAILRLLAQYGFKPDMVAGHSLGEYAALVAAGVLSFPHALEVVSNRGRAMAKVSLDDNGCMAAVSAPLEEVDRIIKSIDGYVVIANINSPLQSVIGGTTAAIDAALAAFDAAGFQGVKIPVSHAFHTRIVAPASQPLRETIARMDIHPARIPVVANVTGQFYPESTNEILDILAQQVASPVQFVSCMDTLYTNGGRIFVEAGPKRVLTALAVDNLKEHLDVTILATNHPRKGGPTSLNEALAGLLAAGIVPQFEDTTGDDGYSRVEPDKIQAEILPQKTNQPIEIQSLQITPEPIAAQRSEAGPSNDAIKDFILAEVTDKTGYPQEMLDLDLDLEGDLGIDTVKQAELFVTLREHYDVPRPDDLRLSDYNTLAKVLSFFSQATADRQKPAAESPTSHGQGNSAEAAPAEVQSDRSNELAHQPLQSEVSPSKVISRRIPFPKLQPHLDFCQETGVKLEEGTRVIVVKDRGRLGDALAQRLKDRKTEVLILDGNNTQNLQDQIASLAGDDRIDGIYFLPSFDPEPFMSDLAPDEWQSELNRRVVLLYTLLHDLPGKPFLICATAFGGLHGFGDQASRAVLSAGTRGFAKAVSRERSSSLIKVIDFEADADLVKAAASLVAETLSGPGDVEIGYHSGLRFAIELKEETLPAMNEISLPKDSIYLVSGGTGGITGPVVLDLARAAGGTFYLMGRTPLPDRSDPLLGRVVGNRDGLRKEWLRKPEDGSSKPTPAVVEARLARLERAAATYEIIHQLEDIGSKVHYLACDMTDFEAVRQAVKTIYSAEGRVDVLIHAAGYESSRKLDNKPLEEVQLTLGVKATGFYYLIKALEEQHCMPEMVVGFASVAGRFGNLGQTDYSAASDLLSRQITSLTIRYPEMTAVCLDWGPWADVGMASRGHIPSLMKMAGVDLLLPDKAAPHVRLELQSSSRGEVVLAGSMGSEEAKQLLNHSVDVDKIKQLLPAGGRSQLLGQLVEYQGMDGITLEVELDPKSEPFLYDHALNGIPILPGVIGVLGFITIGNFAASLCDPHRFPYQVKHLENVYFQVPVKFYRDQPRRLTWKVKVYGDSDGLVVWATLESDLVKHNGNKEHLHHFSGQVFLQPPGQGKKPSGTIEPPYWTSENALLAEDIYRLYFHGPSFQVLEGVTCSGDSFTGKLHENRPAMGADLNANLTLPALLELFMQTAAAWQIGKTGALGLPSELGKVIIYEQEICDAKDDGKTGSIVPPIFAHVTPVSTDKEMLSFDGQIVDSRGQILLQVETFRSASLPYTAEDSLQRPFQILVGK